MADCTRPRNYADGLLDALATVAEVTGPMKLSDFNEKTWKMTCLIQERLAAKAADAFRAEGGPKLTNGEEVNK